MAPHTSNLDFLIGLCAYRSLGREANFLMKSFWFFWPLKYLLRYFGGIPVYRSKKGERGSLTSYLIDEFKKLNYLNLAVTPEGTRSAVSKWHTGFLVVATQAKVPVQLGVIDYKEKRVIIKEEIIPSGDLEADLKKIKNYYREFKDGAKYPAKFQI